MSGLVRIHGLVALELHGHSQHLIGDPAVFHRPELEIFCGCLGMKAARRGESRQRGERRA